MYSAPILAAEETRCSVECGTDQHPAGLDHLAAHLQKKIQVWDMLGDFHGENHIELNPSL